MTVLEPEEFLSDAELRSCLLALFEEMLATPYAGLAPPRCGRCGHAAEDHALDDSSNVSPTDPAAEFRCTFPAKHDGAPPVRLCTCPDWIAP